MQHVQLRSGNNAEWPGDIVNTSQNIEDKQYQNVAEFTKEAGVVQ